jgi:hypothetical protein
MTTPPVTIGSYAICRQLATQDACLGQSYLGTLPRIAERTGFWDTSFTFPDVLQSGAGTILEARDDFGLRRIGHLSDCLSARTMPKVTWKGSNTPGRWIDEPALNMPPSVFAHWMSASDLGPKFAEVENVRIFVEFVGVESLSETELGASLSTCGETIEPGRYLVFDALAVEGLRISFHSKEGPLRLDSDNVSDFLTLPDKPSYSFDSEGGIMMPGRRYVAIQTVVALRQRAAAGDPGSFSRTLAAYCRRAGC